MRPRGLRASARVPGRNTRRGGHRRRHLGVGSRTPAGQPTDVRSRENFAPVWTKDGKRLLFFSPFRESGLFWQAADGTGAAERLGTGLPSGVTPDGKQCSSPRPRGPGPDAADT